MTEDELTIIVLHFKQPSQRGKNSPLFLSTHLPYNDNVYIWLDLDQSQFWLVHSTFLV